MNFVQDFGGSNRFDHPTLNDYQQEPQSHPKYFAGNSLGTHELQSFHKEP